MAWKKAISYKSGSVENLFTRMHALVHCQTLPFVTNYRADFHSETLLNLESKRKTKNKGKSEIKYSRN